MRLPILAGSWLVLLAGLDLGCDKCHGAGGAVQEPGAAHSLPPTTTKARRHRQVSQLRH
jgi:hypothetical protein